MTSAFALAWLLSTVAAGAQPAALTGRVADPQGGAVSGASITLASKDAARPHTAHTSADGAFTIDDVPDGTYVLRVEAAGFQTWTRETIVSAEQRDLAIVLQVEGIRESVEVSGGSARALTTPASTASHLGLTPLETPASLAVVPGDVIRELGTPTLALAKTMAPGITSANNPGNGNNLLSARGFVGTNSVKQLFNGMEIYNAGGVVSFPFDPWTAERIEVLYGPSAILYGTGSIGGAVNVIPRRPDPSQRHHEVSLSAGAFNTYHQAIDSTGPIGGRASYRVDVSHYGSDGWVDRADSNSLAVSTSVRVDASRTLRFTLANDFGNQNPSKYLGTPVLNGQVVEALREKNYNLNDAKLNFRDNWTTLETVWQPSANVAFHNSTYYLYHSRTYRDVTVFTFQPATDTVRRTSYRDIGNDADPTYETQLGDTGYVTVAGRLFGRRNDIVIGFDANRNYYHRNDNVRGGSSTVDAFDFDPGFYLDAYAQQSVPFYRIHVNQVAGFVEDRFAVSDRLSLVAGVRTDYYGVSRYDNMTGLTTDSNYTPTGWNAGAVYTLAPGLVAYGQYAVASDPVNSLSSISANQQGFSLSKGRQVEAGVKQDVQNGRLQWTFAAYRIVKNDLLTPSFDNPTVTEQVGQQSSRGVEGAVALNLGAVRVDANGTVLQARFDDFAATVGGAAVSLAGNVPLNVPRQTANLRALWDVAPAWQARAVLRYVGLRYSDNTNAATTRIPSYRVLDLGVRWRATPRVSLDLRLENAFDALYAESGSTTQWILGAPRALTVSTNVAF